MPRAGCASPQKRAAAGWSGEWCTAQVLADSVWDGGAYLTPCSSTRVSVPISFQTPVQSQMVIIYVLSSCNPAGSRCPRLVHALAHCSRLAASPAESPDLGLQPQCTLRLMVLAPQCPTATKISAGVAQHLGSKPRSALHPTGPAATTSWWGRTVPSLWSGRPCVPRRAPSTGRPSTFPLRGPVEAPWLLPSRAARVGRAWRASHTAAVEYQTQLHQLP